MKQREKLSAIFSIFSIIILSTGFVSAGVFSDWFNDVGNFFDDAWKKISEISGKVVGTEPEVSSASELGSIPTDPDAITSAEPVSGKKCTPTAETCNNKDDDCDNVIDNGLTRTCGTDIGECTAGTQTCSRGKWSVCVGAVYPKSETCDNLDNDCDNLIDDENVCVFQNQTNQTVYHSVCANEQCVRVQGAGADECSTNSQCITIVNVTHKECVGSSCIDVQGPGTNECSTNSQCIITNQTNQTHKECVNNACVSVQGAGTDTCTINSQCIINQTNQTSPTQIIPALSPTGSTDPVSIEARTIEAQNAINAKGFDAASAVGTTFSDSINPATGALTVTQTDVYVPGRNGMDIVLTRQYNSNVFLNLNAETSSGSSCVEKNTVACNSEDPYVNCLPPETGISSYELNSEGAIITGNCRYDYELEDVICDPIPKIRFLNLCNPDSQQYTEASSFKRGRMLGTGWTINTDSRIKDPTPLLFEDGDLTFKYLSPRGINSVSMVLDNNEEELILPAMYRETPGLGPSWATVGVKRWSNDVGNTDGNVYVPGNTAFQNIIREQNNPDDHGISTLEDLSVRSFPTYTSDLSPVYLQYPKAISGFPIPGQESGSGSLQAMYYSKDGKTYYFNHYVPMCGLFDDIRGTTSLCRSIFDSILQDKEYDILNWAENPYAGLYLTGVKDQFGNTIMYEYHEKYGGGPNIPFVNKINNGRGFAELSYKSPIDANCFNCADDSSQLTIDSKLSYITFTGPKGQDLYRIYEYENRKEMGGPIPPLLKKTYILKALSLANPVTGESNVIPGTTYSYEYDPNTRELIKVILPTGAEVEYTYAWAPDIPVFDLARAYVDASQLNKLTKRVVAMRTLKYGGWCEPGIVLPGRIISKPDNCVWLYQYKTVPKITDIGKTFYELETTVYDPDGGKTVYSVYPTIASTLNIAGGGPPGDIEGGGGG